MHLTDDSSSCIPLNSELEALLRNLNFTTWIEVVDTFNPEEQTISHILVNTTDVDPGDFLVS